MLKKDVKEVIVYFSLVIGLSYLVFWGPIALLKVPTVNLVDGQMGPIWAMILFIIGGFVPSIVGVLLTAKYEGKKGVEDLFKRAVKVKIGYKAFIGIIAVPVYFAITLILIAKLTKSTFDYSQFWIQLPTIIPLMILGPLSEELGWRGFAIKRLLRCINANLTSLIMGIVWALWHLTFVLYAGNFPVRARYAVNNIFTFGCWHFVYIHLFLHAYKCKHILGNIFTLAVHICITSSHKQRS